MIDCWYAEKRRLELLPEDLCRQFTQTLQEMLLPDLHRHLEDFRSPSGTGTFLRPLSQRLTISFSCVADVDVQTEAQHGSDSGWGRALQAGYWAGKRGLRQGMFLCRTYSLKDRGYSVSSCSRLNVQTWIFPLHDWVLTVIHVAGRPRNPQKKRSGATNLTFEFF